MTRLVFISLIVLLLGAVAGAQDDSAPNPLTPLQATIDAGIAARFTATALAVENPSVYATIDAAFAAAQTSTQNALEPASSAATDTPADTAPALDTARFVVLPTRTEIISGGTFEMGTTADEVRRAVDLCVSVHAGNCTLQMGADSVPLHTVTLNPFEMEITEVTYSQYVTFLNSMGPGSHLTGCDGQVCLLTNAENENAAVLVQDGLYTVQPILNQAPVTYVTWYGAAAYCAALGRRLPAEAEWERAARGGDGRIYPWGNDWDETRARTSIPEDGTVGALAVGSYVLGGSPFGLFDMAGNVAEWVSDWYDELYYRRPEASGLNPTGPASGDDKVVRGGSWDAKPFFARAVHRQHFPPDRAGAWLGFRCAADLALELTPTPLPALSPPDPTATPADAD
jgi:formylglycine-generating enzyme required for sulfatase activity